MNETDPTGTFGDVVERPPAVGRIVHYRSHGTPVREDGTQAYPALCRAAVITEVLEMREGMWLVSLAVLNPTGAFFNRRVHQDDTARTGGTWHWPEMV